MKATDILALIDKQSAFHQEQINRISANKRFFEGEQYPLSEEERDLSDKPLLVVNHLFPRIQAVAGSIVRQRPQIKVLPRGKFDAMVSQIATVVIRYLLEVNKFPLHLYTALLDSLVCGIGWLRARVNPDLTSEPIKLESLSPEEVIYDYKDKSIDLSSGRYVAVYKLIPEEEARAIYGDFRPAVLLSWIDINQYTWLDSESVVSVIEGEYRKWTRTQVVWDGVQAEVYTPQLHDRLLSEGKVRLTEMAVPVVHKFLVVGETVIYDEPTPFTSYSFVPVIFHRTQDGYPMGLVDLLKDLQKEINKRRSKALHYLDVLRVIAEEGAVKEPSDLLKELERTVSFIEYRPQYKLEIQRELELSATHYKFLEGAIQELTLISGISPDLMGLPTNARTGTALQMRVLQAMTGLVHLLLKVEEAFRSISYRAFNLARLLYTDTRFVELTDLAINELGLFNPEQMSELEKLRSKLVEGRFDLIVKVGATDTTQRQEHLAHLVELLKVLPPETILVMFDILIDAFDLPEKSEIKKRLALLISTMLKSRQKGGNEDGRKQ